jgi:predicted flap endonuclease-1-like 5' DNA nuclease
MLHYLIELAVWMLLAYFAGCCIGCLLRQIFGSEPALEAAGQVPTAELATEPGHSAAALARTSPASADDSVGKLARPKGASAPRGGKPDKLQRISGVGPKNEKILHSLGIYHFDQIAGWTAAEVNWVDDHLKFNGRIRREEWINQARLLAEGNDAEFAKLYGSGGKS